MATDPTGTWDLRREADMQIREAYHDIRQWVREQVVIQNALGIELAPVEKINPIGPKTVEQNGRTYTYRYNKQNTREFLRNFNNLVNARIGAFGPASSVAQWRMATAGTLTRALQDLVEQGFQRGTYQTRAGLKAEWRRAGRIFQGGSVRKPPLSRPIFDNRTLDVMRYAGSRTFNNMRKLTTQMKKDMRRAILTGIAEGLDERQIGQMMDQSLQRSVWGNGIGNSGAQTRAELISRTEITAAYQFATDNEIKKANEQLGPRSKVEYRSLWETMQDSRVRDQHEALHGKILKRQEAFKHLAAPNCRCRQIAILVNKLTGKPVYESKRRQARRAQIRLT